MPATGAISDKERWVIRIDVEGERDQAEADRLAEALDRLVAKFSKQNREAKWEGKTFKSK